MVLIDQQGRKMLQRNCARGTRTRQKEDYSFAEIHQDVHFTNSPVAIANGLLHMGLLPKTIDRQVSSPVESTTLHIARTGAGLRALLRFSPRHSEDGIVYRINYLVPGLVQRRRGACGKSVYSRQSAVDTLHSAELCCQSIQNKVYWDSRGTCCIIWLLIRRIT